MSQKAIAKAIKKAREEAEISQAQLAIALEYRLQRFHGINRHISQQSVSKWEKRGSLGAIELIEISQITGKSLYIGGTLITPQNRLNARVLWIIALSYWMYLASLDEEI